MTRQKENMEENENIDHLKKKNLNKVHALESP